MTQNKEPKRYYRSDTDRMLAGVCGGLAEYFNIDSTIVRLVAVLLAVFTSGAAVFAYVILAIIVPKRPIVTTAPKKSETKSGSTKSASSKGPILDKK
jgi:phage shock protein PspC (stress-responsive transcriptional regulator)